VLTIAALPPPTMELKVNLFAIAPGVEYFPRLAHAMPIDLA
jgi:hypothetical protein